MSVVSNSFSAADNVSKIFKIYHFILCRPLALFSYARFFCTFGKFCLHMKSVFLQSLKSLLRKNSCQLYNEGWHQSRHNLDLTQFLQCGLPINADRLV